MLTELIQRIKARKATERLSAADAYRQFVANADVLSAADDERLVETLTTLGLSLDDFAADVRTRKAFESALAKILAPEELSRRIVIARLIEDGRFDVAVKKRASDIDGKAKK